MPHSRALNSYFTLGRTGLRVSLLALGTMTFGTEWGWGTDKEIAREPVKHMSSRRASPRHR
jgi:aryl-alcohol dehydrogenase-like predicted oxidoreductase